MYIYNPKVRGLVSDIGWGLRTPIDNSLLCCVQQKIMKRMASRNPIGNRVVLCVQDEVHDYSSSGKD